jgi:hypothetical protein
MLRKDASFNGLLGIAEEMTRTVHEGAIEGKRRETMMEGCGNVGAVPET